MTVDLTGPSHTPDALGEGTAELRRRMIGRLRARAAGGVARGSLTEVEPLIFRYADMQASAFIRYHYDVPIVGTF